MRAFKRSLEKMVLRYSVQPSRDSSGELSPKEDFVLRRAFGCAPEASFRATGQGIVSRHFEKEHWLLCDCRPDAKRAPTLFLKGSGFIQRENPEVGTPHDEDCVFYRDDEGQRKYVRSFRKGQKNDRVFQLVRNFNSNERDRKPSLSFSTRQTERDKLAKILFELVSAAGLDKLDSDDDLTVSKDRKQAAMDRLKQAAADFYLDKDHRLSDWLATSWIEHKQLKGRLAKASADWRRPHGIYIDTFTQINGNDLILKDPNNPLDRVTGKLSVFGEKNAEKRPPYLFIGLIAQPFKVARHVEILRGYAHPCLSWGNLLPVDSQYERETMDVLVQCRNWLMKKFGVSYSIEKPLFDIGSDDDAAREICKPDFVLRTIGSNAKVATVVIETMGYDSEQYRERKLRMRAQFEHIGGSGEVIPVIEHDLRLKMAKNDIHRQLCQSIRDTVVTGRPAQISSDLKLS